MYIHITEWSGKIRSKVLIPSASRRPPARETISAKAIGDLNDSSETISLFVHDGTSFSNTPKKQPAIGFQSKRNICCDQNNPNTHAVQRESAVALFVEDGKAFGLKITKIYASFRRLKQTSRQLSQRVLNSRVEAWNNLLKK